jgi:hypothetical protein
MKKSQILIKMAEIQILEISGGVDGFKVYFDENFEEFENKSVWTWEMKNKHWN